MSKHPRLDRSAFPVMAEGDIAPPGTPTCTACNGRNGERCILVPGHLGHTMALHVDQYGYHFEAAHHDFSEADLAAWEGRVVRDYLSTISRSRPQVTRTCEHCGATFEARDSRARYCPRPKSCRELAMRARRKAKSG